MNLEQLSEYFHMPINDVAKELGVCATVLKKICRRNGIPRWPHRKIKSIDKRVVTLETTMPKTAEEDQRIKQEVNALKERKQYLMKNPGILAVKSNKKSGKLLGITKRNTNTTSITTEDESEKEESLKIQPLIANPTTTLLSSIYPSFPPSPISKERVPPITIEDTHIFNTPSFSLNPPNYSITHDNISSLNYRLPEIKDIIAKKDIDTEKTCPKFLEPDWTNSCNNRLPQKRPLPFINYSCGNPSPLPSKILLFDNWNLPGKNNQVSLPELSPLKFRDRDTYRTTEAAEAVISLASFSTDKQNTLTPTHSISRIF